MCQPLTLCVKKKFEVTRETVIFSVEIVELKEGGSGWSDGDLLLGGLHLSCDMYSGLEAWIEIYFLASTLTLSHIAHSHYCCTPTKGQCSICTFHRQVQVQFQQPQHLELFLFSTHSPPFLLLLPALHLCRQYPPSCNPPRPSPSLPTFSFQKLRITAAPPREVCENAQCRSPGVPTLSAECEKRALHLMPDWPNLLPDSWVFLFPVAQREHGQKWCGRRREGTVIVSRSVEIPQPPTHLSPLPSSSP